MVDHPHDSDVVARPAAAVASTGTTADQYRENYRRSLDDPDGFWAEQAERLEWTRKPATIANWSFDPVAIRWFEDGELNLCHNAVDRHVAAGRGGDIAIVFEPDDPAGTVRRISYADLRRDVVKIAATLRHMGVRKGDRVTIYMPMIP